jgi:hypothetical protein
LIEFGRPFTFVVGISSGDEKTILAFSCIEVVSSKFLKYSALSIFNYASLFTWDGNMMSDPNPM